MVHICHTSHGKTGALESQSIGTLPSAHGPPAGGGGAARGFRFSGLLKLGLICLNSIASGGTPLTAQRWAEIWSEISGTFWLSRLCRDGDAIIRLQAFSLLGSIVAPGAGAARKMLEASWPEAPAFTASVALGGGAGRMTGGTNRSEDCSAVRAAALRFLSGALGIREEEEDGDSAESSTIGGGRRETSASHRMGGVASRGGPRVLKPLSPHLLLMENEVLWGQLPAMAREAGAGEKTSDGSGGSALMVASLSTLLQVRSFRCEGVYLIIHITFFPSLKHDILSKRM